MAARLLRIGFADAYKGLLTAPTPLVGNIYPA